jgi:hypothetical protein
MNIIYLQHALSQIKTKIEATITTATFVSKSGEHKTKNNGLEAKNALIKSEQLIQVIHEVVKNSIHNELKKQNITRNYKIHPDIGSSSPEQKAWGFFKKKAQDVVITFTDPTEEEIIDGALKGQIDKLGRRSTEESIIIGVRSQLSSIAKNYDTLMERMFAESLNLRLRNPKVVMGDVYLIPAYEYLTDPMKQNQVSYSSNKTDIEAFISIFNSFTGREDYLNRDDFLKYECSSLIIVDLNQNPIKIYENLSELKADGLVSQSFNEPYDELLAPSKFAKNIIFTYRKRQKLIEKEEIKVRLNRTKSGSIESSKSIFAKRLKRLE